MNVCEFVLARVAEDEYFALDTTSMHDWSFKTRTNVKRVVYNPVRQISRATGKRITWRDEVLFRINSALSTVFVNRRKQWESDLIGDMNLQSRLRMAKHSLFDREKHLPDGRVSSNLIYWAEDGWHMERHSPLRVIAQCESFRQIVQNAQRHTADERGYGAAMYAVRRLAMIWSQHPDFQASWSDGPYVDPRRMIGRRIQS